MILHTFLDFFDGCVARMQQKTSSIGALLDNIADLGYYIPLYGFVLYTIYTQHKCVFGLFGVSTLLGALYIFTCRFHSFTLAVDYISLMFEIDRDKIPHIKTDTAPFYDFFILLTIIYIIPIFILFM